MIRIILHSKYSVNVVGHRRLAVQDGATGNTDYWNPDRIEKKKYMRKVSVFLFLLTSCVSSIKDPDNEQGVSCISVTDYTGMCEETYADGTIRYQIGVLNGKVHGHLREYYRNGKIKYSLKVNRDRLVEVVEAYDENGNKLDCGSLINGNGEIKIYESRGFVTFYGKYVNGLKEGDWITLDFRGRVVDTMHFVNGRNERGVLMIWDGL